MHRYAQLLLILYMDWECSKLYVFGMGMSILTLRVWIELYQSHMSMVKSTLCLSHTYYHLHNHEGLSTHCLQLATHHPKKRTLQVW